MAKYDIDETLAEGDPNHIEHHIAVAQAVNDLDERVDGKADLGVDGKVLPSQIPSQAAPEYPVAGINTPGMMRGVYLAPGSPLPSPLLAWTLVVRTA